MLSSSPVIHQGAVTLVCIALCAPIFTSASETVFICPKEYSSSSLHVTRERDGWISTLPPTFILNSAGIMEGPVEERGILKPEPQTFKDRYEEIYVGLGGHPTYETWVWCAYGVGNDIMLVKPLAQAIKRCVVTYRPSRVPKQFKVDRISCT